MKGRKLVTKQKGTHTNVSKQKYKGKMQSSTKEQASLQQESKPQASVSKLTKEQTMSLAAIPTFWSIANLDHSCSRSHRQCPLPTSILKINSTNHLTLPAPCKQKQVGLFVCLFVLKQGKQRITFEYHQWECSKCSHS